MKKTFFAALASFVLSVSAAYAGTVTFDFGGSKVVLTTTAAQDAALDNLRVQANANNVLNPSLVPAASLEDYVSQILAGNLSNYYAQARQLEQKAACVTYQALVKLSQDSIKTTLAGKSPCP